MKKRLLIIEEHEHFRKLLSVYLSQKYQVLPARNGVEAMGWIIRGFLPGVIISGPVIPESNTEDFLNSVQYSGTLCDIPVIRYSPEHSTETFCLKTLEKEITGLLGSKARTTVAGPSVLSEQAAVALG